MNPNARWRSERIGDLTQSHIRRMTRECEAVGGINLGQGVCDLATPREILSAASEAVLADRSVYSKFEGIDELRQAIAVKAQTFNHISGVDPDTHVVVTVGSSGAFHCTVQALFDPGDEILVFEPYYGYHVNTLKAGGLRPVFATLHPPEWRFDAALLERALSPRLRGVIVNTPTNPSGKVYSRDELDLVAIFCREHDLLAITDEIYEYITYDGRPHESLASRPGMWERTVTISGFSKTFSITGWRLGYALAPAHLAEPIGLVNDLFYICAPTPLQHALAAGLRTIESDYYREMAADYERKRDLVCTTLGRIGLRPHVPQGAYYVLADVRGLGCPDDVRAAMTLLREAGVASVPGSSFYSSGAGNQVVRFCYAKEWPTLKEACQRLTTWRS